MKPFQLVVGVEGAGLRVAMVGTRGVPARYGGFETCVEEVGRRLASRGIEVVVYCRGGSTDPHFLGMELVQLPALRLKAAETLSHSLLSILHVVSRTRRPDVVLLFNAANAVLIPLLRLRRIPVIVHMDGIEWMRSKWGRFGKTWYRLSERLAVRWADRLIADAEGIRRYLFETHGAASELIAYGAPVVERTDEPLSGREFPTDGFYLIVARFEPENHVLELVQGFCGTAIDAQLVVVGGGAYSSRYVAAIREVAAADSRIVLLGPVWDQDYLDQLYARCRAYLHGHSVGGTNPSLLRAIGAGAPVVAWDNEFNREVTNDGAKYCRNPEGVATQLKATGAESLEDARENAQRLAHSARQRYDWDAVCAQYEVLLMVTSEARTQAQP